MPKRTKKSTKTTSTKASKTTKVRKVSTAPKAKVTKTAKVVKKANVAKRKKVVQTPVKTPKSKSALLALLGIFIGIQLMCASGWYMLYRRTILSFQVAPVVTADHHTEVPIAIEIGNKNINLPVIPATINDGIWPLDDHNALHLATSAYPGERGNIVIYGHNTMPVFGNLKQVTVGDTIKITSDTDVVHNYVVKEVLRVKPSDIQVVLPTDHEVLTVYTCIGWLDSERLVLKAYPEVSAKL
jgi:LPXTG-site transpeptidase (sortase) family protein